MYTLYSLPLLTLLAAASPVNRRATFTLQNGLEAQALNAQFATLTTSSPCTVPQTACVNGGFAQCVGGSFVVTGCTAGEICGAAPLVNSPGTSIICDTEADLLQRIANTGATGGLTGDGSIAAPSASLAATTTPAAVAAVAAAAATAAPAASASPAAAASTSQGGIQVPAACSALASRKRSLAPRIAQNLPQVVAPWRTACEASGGDITTNDPCDNLSTGAGLNALLAGADPCAQQNVADEMIDYALSAGVINSAQLISIAQAYRQNARNALNINGIVPSTYYCEQAPRNSQLNGLFNAQLDGVDPGVFGNSGLAEVAFGASGTCPFGQTPNVNTCTCS